MVPEGSAPCWPFLYPSFDLRSSQPLLWCFLFSATSFGIVLVLGGGQVQTIETAIYFSATQFLDLEAAAALVFIQTLITAAAFLVGSSLAKGTVGLEQVFEGTRKPRVDKRDWPASVLTAGIVVGLLVMPMLLVLVEAFKVGDGWGFTTLQTWALVVQEIF
jgi:thiamine transport system permease protein